MKICKSTKYDLLLFSHKSQEARSTTMASRKGKIIEPRIQRAVAVEYRKGVRGCGYKALAKKYGIAEKSARNIVNRSKRGRRDPVASRGHKRRKLTAGEERRICTHLDKHPDATNEQLAKVVHNKIVPQTVSKILARASPPFSKKKFVDQEPEELTEEWKQEAHVFVGRVRKIAFSRRVYSDESGIYSNEAPTFGRARVGKKLFRSRKRHGKKYTLHTFVKERAVLYWTLRDKNANDLEVRKVMRSAVKTFEEGDVLIWDRLGRSGRSKNPKAQHYNPSVVQSVKDRGAEVWYLPPKGKYFNPAELLFNDLKNHFIRPAYGKSCKEMSKDKLTRIIRKYMREVAPERLPGFFRARANGAHAKSHGLF